MNITQIKKDLTEGVIVSSTTWSELVEWAVKAEEALAAGYVAQETISDDDIRTAFMQAAVTCGHTIKSEDITLYRDSRNFGNALGQLADRLLQAYKDVQSGQHPPASNDPTLPPILLKHVEGIKFIGHHSVQIIMNDVGVINNFIAAVTRDLAAKEPQ